MKDLLTRALDAHGGLSRWREIEAFQLKVSLGGGLWRLKGLPDGLRDVTLRVQAHRPIVTIMPFGGEARTGHFTPDRVWIEDANGVVVEERAMPRASFAGHGRQREFCRTWRNQTEVTVEGIHFIQEDSPEEIGEALAAFVRSLRSMLTNRESESSMFRFAKISKWSGQPSADEGEIMASAGSANVYGNLKGDKT
jgi:hypothetical protein